MKKNFFNKKLSKKQLENAEGWLFMAPSIMISGIFLIIPILLSFYLSFREYSLFDGSILTGGEFVGIENYKKALEDESFRVSIWNVIYYTLLMVPSTVFLSLGLALIANQKMKGKGIFRVIYYIPSITSMVAVSIIFLFIFKLDGIVNKILNLVGLKSVSWFFSPEYAMPTIAIMGIWMSAGFYMIIFLAGLQDIPASLYEAARIDGANAWQRFRYITLPSIKGKMFFVVISLLIGSFQLFDQVFVISGGTGGPGNSTMTVILKVYQTAFRDLKFGYASAMAFILLAIILIVTLINKIFFKEE
jgi:multiple sugar transport system permease protein